MNRKSIRNLCFVIGVTLFIVIMIYSIFHTNDLWNNEFKAESFNSFVEYYFSRAKGEIIIALCSGITFVTAGIYIGRKEPNH